MKSCQPIGGSSKILSNDGGGIRGIIPAIVLAEIERRTEQRISKLFDLIVGTSTGGMSGQRIFGQPVPFPTYGRIV
jgi:patatin-like phospholipase/acyl hydrolase